MAAATSSSSRSSARSSWGTAASLLLVVLPNALPALGSDAVTRAASYLPGSAAGSLLTGAAEPYPPLVATAVLAAWALGALLLGHAWLRGRAA